MLKVSRPLLLDTHIWIWLCTGDEKLKKSPLLGKIEQSGHTNKLFLSVISIWEAGMLISKNRLTIDCPALDWISNAIHLSHVITKELSLEAAVQSSLLLNELHEDPSDRMIVATAIENKSILATQDKKILDYAAKNNIPTLSI